MTVTRAEFDHKGTRYAVAFEPMPDEGSGRTRKLSKTRFHFAIREIRNKQELSVMVGDYEIGIGCHRASLYPGLRVDAFGLMCKAGRLFNEAESTEKYHRKQCCTGKVGQLCDRCQLVRDVLAEMAEKRNAEIEAGRKRMLNRRHCHHKIHSRTKRGEGGRTG